VWYGVKPKEATQRSGDLPTLIPFRRSAWRRPSVPEHLAAQFKNLLGRSISNSSA